MYLSTNLDPSTVHIIDSSILINYDMFENFIDYDLLDLQQRHKLIFESDKYHQYDIQNKRKSSIGTNTNKKCLGTLNYFLIYFAPFM